MGADVDLHTQVEMFYARHMQLLGDEDFEGWARTFTEDATFGGSSHSEPLRGRAAIADGGRRGQQVLTDKGLVHRRWLGMVTVDPRQDGSLAVRSYGVVVQTERDGGSVPVRPAVFEDLLVPSQDGWLISQRVISRDDQP
ncbi:hypothetical protein GCM10010174_27120 [Kutzneria viridogrisea]|uniref:SnoaL-like domain-containing protein n=1 Tax=Kutzneria viridogrisea TaxID=47990 RepID=A0ABR6BVZ5_9PSEU|nr:hypothetical protein [Kutzneria viridogrisea]